MLNSVVIVVTMYKGEKNEFLCALLQIAVYEYCENRGKRTMEWNIVYVV